MTKSHSSANTRFACLPQTEVARQDKIALEENTHKIFIQINIKCASYDYAYIKEDLFPVIARISTLVYVESSKKRIRSAYIAVNKRVLDLPLYKVLSV